MSFDPKQFAKNLKSSTLSEKEQEALLDLLPHLSNEQIDEIAEILLKNSIEQESIMRQLSLKVDILKNSK